MKKIFAMFSIDICFHENGKLVFAKTDPRRVRIMASAEGYSMVRFPGATPFVVKQKDLQECSKEAI